ncbi:nuclear transport factor 2-like protein [Salinimicrobium sp. CAU 1759]
MKKRTEISGAVLLFLCLLTGVSFVQSALGQVDGEISLDFPEEDKLMEVARETVKAYETGNWESLRRNSTADARFYNLGSYDSLTVDQTVQYWKKGRETATPVLSEDGVWLGVTVPEGPRKGNWILHWGTNTLSYPTGETISFPYHVALKFQEDKVGQYHFYYDNNRIIRALGYEIQPPLEEEEKDFLEDYEDKQ